MFFSSCMTCLTCMTILEEGYVVRVSPGRPTYAPRQGILLTVTVSLDPGVVHGYRSGRTLFLVCHVHLQVAGHSRGNNTQLFVKRL